MGIFDITDKYMEAKSAQVNSEFKPSKLHEQPLVVEVQNRENNNEKSFIYILLKSVSFVSLKWIFINLKNIFKS